MTHPVPSECPFCHKPMQVTEVSCGSCDVQMRGSFSPARYDRLAPDQLQFLETFLRCRGVIRDVEASLGISYPTVRARLDALLSALDFTNTPAAPAPDKAARRREILAAIDAGTLGAEAGLKALQDL